MCQWTCFFNPGVAGLLFFLFPLCKTLCLFILYNDLFHVLYTEELLKSWINFEIKVLVSSEHGQLQWPALLQKQLSPNGTVGLLDAHLSFPDLIRLLYKSEDVFVDPLCSYLDQDGQNSSSLRNLICRLHDCPSLALHRNYKGWSFYSLFLCPITGHMDRKKGTKPAS